MAEPREQRKIIADMEKIREMGRKRGGTLHGHPMAEKFDKIYRLLQKELRLSRKQEETFYDKLPPNTAIPLDPEDVEMRKLKAAKNVLLSAIVRVVKGEIAQMSRGEKESRNRYLVEDEGCGYSSLPDKDKDFYLDANLRDQMFEDLEILLFGFRCC